MISTKRVNIFPVIMILFDLRILRNQQMNQLLRWLWRLMVQNQLLHRQIDSAFYGTQKFESGFFSKSLSYYFENDVNGNGKLIHFATLRTILPIYQVEKRKVDYVWEHGCKWTVETTAADILFSKGKKWCFEKIVSVGIR